MTKNEIIEYAGSILDIVREELPKMSKEVQDEFIEESAKKVIEILSPVLEV